jgi:transposase
MGGQHKRGIARDQTALLPPTIEDYVAGDSVARLIEAYVSGLDMARLGFKRTVAADTGRPGYAPDDLLRLYLYGYWKRMGGSRKLEEACSCNLEVMWLMRQLRPDDWTICAFRRANSKPFRAACAEFVQFLREAALVGGESPTVAIDGSKFKACASRASVMNAEQLKKQREKIDKQIERYLEELDEADRREQGEVRPTAEQIQDAIAKLRQRQKKLDQAQVELAACAAQTDAGQSARVGLSDPECVMLKDKARALAGYNVQHAVDTKHKFIVAHEVTTCGNDHTSLEPMALQAKEALKAHTLTALADTGYANGEQAQACEKAGITPVVRMAQVSNTRDSKLYAKGLFTYDGESDTYRCPAGELLRRYKRDQTSKTDYYWSAACAGCAHKAHCTKSERRSIARSWFAAAAERADQRARSAPWLMRLRSATAEHPFGNLKAMLPGGFALRGLLKVKGEMALAVLTYNLKRAAAVLGTDQLIQRLRMRSVLDYT